jgi:aminoacylase
MNSSLARNLLSNDECEAAIERLCQIIQFPTVSSIAAESGDYRRCAEWLLEQLRDICLFDEVFFLTEAPYDSPVVVAKWKGYDESLPIILLNSHYDVVPADDTQWTVPPFRAIRKNGKIYGRGTQDMKCVCIQYIEGVRKIHATDPNWKPLRNVFLTFVPDEGRTK